MLRGFVLAFGALLLGGGLLGCALGLGPAMLGPITFGALILTGTIFEQHYHRNQAGPPPTGFERTGERFHDPDQGEIVEVWYNKTTGERRYVAPSR